MFQSEICGETSQLLEYVSVKVLIKSQMKTQGGKSLIITVILIGIDLSSSWELFISAGNTYFHRSRNDIYPKREWS